MEQEKQMESQGPHAERRRRRQGGLRTMPFIFANEISEKLAVVGFSSNMITYLTQQLHMPLTKSATTLTNFSGTASLTPIFGAFLADSYIGRFWTITLSSIVYQLGMITLTVSAVLPQFRPPPCAYGSSSSNCVEASSWQLAVLYVSLLLTAVGAGGIRPCVVAFGAEQFDESDPKEKTRTWNFFNWYYFCMGVSVLLAVTVVVYIQDNVGWGWGLGIPAIAMALSVASFVAGYPIYRKLDPTGSPFTRLAQVMVAAFRKRKVAMVSDPGLLYENDELDAPISLFGKLLHTKHFSFLDKAAIVTEQDQQQNKFSSQSHPNLWRLTTVHRIEELKSVIRMVPIWAAGILAVTSSAQQHTFSLQQARAMDRHFTKSSSFQIPPGSMTVFAMLAMLSTISLYDRLLIPFARRFTGLARGMSFLHRIAVGLAISTIASLVAGFVERRRKSFSHDSAAPMSVFFLVPQYGLHGVAEAFTSIGHLEFFYDQSPESMRSTATALYWLVVSAGNYMSTLLVSMIHKYSAGPGGSNWLPNNLDEGKLEYFYWIVTGLQVVNLVYYAVCVRFYTFKPLQIRPREEAAAGSEDGAAVLELTSKV